MIKQDCQETYQNIQGVCQKIKTKCNYFAIGRFLLIFGFFACLLVGYFEKQEFLYYVAFFCLFVFFIVVYYHDRFKQELVEKQAMAHVYQKHIQRMDNEWDTFSDTGDDLVLMSAKAEDLDIVGSHSLFQMINIAFTHKGQTQLAELLVGDGVDYNDVSKHQDAILELSTLEDFVIQLETYGHLIDSHKEVMIQKFMKIHQKTSYRLFPRLCFGLSLVTCFGLIGMIFSIGQPYAMVIFEVGALLQLILAIAFLRKHHSFFEPVMTLEQSIQNYLKVFQLIQKTTFKSQLLKEQQVIICDKGQVVKGIQELSKMAQFMKYRRNIFLIIMFNAIGLYDFWVRNRYIRWLDCYGESIEAWFEGLAQIEVWASLAVLRIDHFDVVQPSIQEKKCLSFTDLRHPFLPQDQVVGNSFQMDASVCIITGSNMSGKTTFMRTIGLNLVLAYAGGFVFAQTMTCSYMHMMTSMRIKDNVEMGISTFYAELLRIKEMIDYSYHKKPMICLIDEIFKGTNSLDRIAGAKATIQKLSQPYHMTFLTTHDFELSKDDYAIGLNYHFDEYYEDNHIHFDYKIKEGPSQTTNGQFLLKQLGIMEEK